MKQQLSSRTEAATDIGQEAVKILIREPVREAVREALAEQQQLDEPHVENQPAESSDDGSGMFSLSRIVLLAGLIGAVIAIRRYRSDNLDAGPIIGKDEKSDHPASRSSDEGDSDSQSTSVVGAADDDMD